jgi:hypothetical protein
VSRTWNVGWLCAQPARCRQCPAQERLDTRPSGSNSQFNWTGFNRQRAQAVETHVVKQHILSPLILSHILHYSQTHISPDPSRRLSNPVPTHSNPTHIPPIPSPFSLFSSRHQNYPPMSTTDFERKKREVRRVLSSLLHPPLTFVLPLSYATLSTRSQKLCAAVPRSRPTFQKSSPAFPPTHLSPPIKTSIIP